MSFSIVLLQNTGRYVMSPIQGYYANWSGITYEASWGEGRVCLAGPQCITLRIPPSGLWSTLLTCPRPETLCREGTRYCLVRWETHSPSITLQRATQQSIGIPSNTLTDVYNARGCYDRRSPYQSFQPTSCLDRQENAVPSQWTSSDMPLSN